MQTFPDRLRCSETPDTTAVTPSAASAAWSTSRESARGLLDRAALAASKFDAIVLDRMLPDGCGLAMLKELRQSGDDAPVLVLTALDEVDDKIKGLDAGADDYLGKPFDLNELAARIRAIVRRRSGRASPRLALGGLVLDPADLSKRIGPRKIS